MVFNEKKLAQLDRITRLNIINSISGIKPGNLIGTRSKQGQNNLAIMSSAVHLGSDPALIGLILRPQLSKTTDTYRNIKETRFYTMNHIPMSMVANAHYTSAKFPPEVSEFDSCNIDEEMKDDFYAPFVKESPLKIGLEFVQENPISLNDTILVIGKVKYIEFADQSMNDEGSIDLENIGSTGISGLNHYYSLQKIQSLPYAHLDQIPKF
jgi:flavin reductase (DIM6/NTAB) family NADH-FMN oxidoreductase RutF